MADSVRKASAAATWTWRPPFRGERSRPVIRYASGLACISGRAVSSEPGMQGPSTEPAAARLGALITPGARPDAIVVDVGAGTIDVIATIPRWWPRESATFSPPQSRRHWRFPRPRPSGLSAARACGLKVRGDLRARTVAAVPRPARPGLSSRNARGYGPSRAADLRTPPRPCGMANHPAAPEAGHFRG